MLYLAVNRQYGITVGPFTRYSMYAEKFQLADSTHFYYISNKVANNPLRYRVPDLVQMQMPIINEPTIQSIDKSLTATNDSFAKLKAKKNLSRYCSKAYQIKDSAVIIREAIIVWDFKTKSIEIKNIN